MEELITYPSLRKFNEIAHFCSSRQGGVSVGNYASRNLSLFTGDEPEKIRQNFQRLTSLTGINFQQMIIPRQTHSSNILNIDSSFLNQPPTVQNQQLNDIDALITNMPEVCLCISTADCVPLTFYDRSKKVVGAAHAGWRGTCAQIAVKTVNAMTKTYHSNPEDIFVGIGPSISAKVYNVGSELLTAFENEGFPIDQIFHKKAGQLFLDLWEANRWQLEQSGIPSEQIEISGHCTFTEHERFFSARRLGIQSGRLLSGIVIK